MTKTKQAKETWLEKADLFAFTPVPTGENYSTQRSRYGTVIFVVIFLLYLAYTLYSFICHNLPLINQFTNRLDDSAVYSAPNMAFAFLTGDNLNVSFQNSSYFTFSFQQVTVYSNPNIPRNYTNIGLSTCRPTWLNPAFDVLCPNAPTNVQGLLYGSPVNMYPRMKVTLCNNATTNNTCASLDDINWILMTGRLFVFIEQYDTYDYASGEYLEDDTPFTSYYYFIVMSQYNRAELKMQAEEVSILPDLFTSFSEQQMQIMSLPSQNFYVSVVPTNVTRDVFVWWISMADTSIVTTVGYDTSLDVMSNVAAMWGLLFSVFALYFLRFNQSRYYDEKPHMINFDEKITPLVEDVLKSDDPNLDTSTDPSSQDNRAKKEPHITEIELPSISKRQYQTEEIY